MDEKILIGAHTSTAGGLHNALIQGQEIGATVIQLFTGNQRQWKRKEITEDAIQKWEETLALTGISHVMSHDSYLINLGSNNEEILTKSKQAFQNEITRCHTLKIPFLNFHPGAAVNSTEEECLNAIINSLSELQGLILNGSTLLLLEATAGQGTSVGCKFEHLGYIINQLKGKIPLGVCIDTCHIFAAGYDIRTKETLEETLKQFDRIVGLKHLHAFHINDSVKGLGMRVDRHADLGNGLIGLETFKLLMTHPLTAHLPKYLETPSGPAVWTLEIAQLKEFFKEPK